MKIEITTRDGRCPSYVFRPNGNGPWHAVLVFMDGVGIRPAMLEVGERIARAGYFVLLPDLFYRAGAYEPMDAKTVFTDPEKRKILMEKFFAVAQAPSVMSDVQSFLDFLTTQPDVKKGPIATTGYCMGARMSFIAAATYPDRIAISAGFHPGRLVTEDADSPHHLASKIRVPVYMAQAIDDPSFTDEMKDVLERSLREAHVDFTIEKYPAKHGWAVSDTPVYDKACAERHYEKLRELLARHLH